MKLNWIIKIINEPKKRIFAEIMPLTNKLILYGEYNHNGNWVRFVEIEMQPNASYDDILYMIEKLLTVFNDKIKTIDSLSEIMNEFKEIEYKNDNNNI